VTRNFTLTLGLALLGLAGCGQVDANPPHTKPSDVTTLTAVLVDRSTSRTPPEVTQDRRLLASIINQLRFGDRILIQEVHRSGRRDSAGQWMTQMPVAKNPLAPTAVDVETLRRARSAAAVAVTQVFDTVRPNLTDLFSTMFDVQDVKQEVRLERTRIVVLSDMLQSSGGIDMERAGGIPDTSWLATQKQRGLLPDLAGACVVVIGADRSTPRGKDVFRFWENYFRRTGSHLEASNYTYLLFEGQQLGC